MGNFFCDAKWIWYTENVQVDTYGDFSDSFEYTDGKAICRISCDGDYTLFINGKFAASNQYGDFEHYKIYDSIDITELVKIGENKIDITVWHLGIGSSRYRPGKAGLLYEVECGGKVIAQSDENTLSRENPNYKGGYGKMITGQLGQSFLFDATKQSDAPYGRSLAVDKDCKLYSRPIEKSVLQKEKEVTVLKNEGNYFLIDLGEETVGLPTLDFVSDAPQKITVCWGEHILDGGVRSKIGGRDFSFEYIAKSGENRYTNYMLRLGCRYLEVFCESPIQPKYIGLIPQVYPTKVLPKVFDDPLKQKIYDLSVNTLQLCMMEHYVDTPWREQAFYAFDSRNQMLCGYRAFENGNREYARANLLLISKDTRDDGLLSITYPSGGKRAIPSFSLHYFTALREYLDETNDLSLANEVYEKLLTVIPTFEKQMKNGLLETFEKSCHWNFYDWSVYMYEGLNETNVQTDLMLNCLFVIALENFKVISEKIGKPYGYEKTVQELRCNIKKEFFSKEHGLFSMIGGKEWFSELGNAVAILADIPTQEECRAIAEKILSNSLKQCSLSMKCFKYDALLKVDSAYRDAIIKEICDTYSVMINNGATSVWEVIEGAEAFDNAGSLCHGWSAIPILYL